MTKASKTNAILRRYTHECPKYHRLRTIETVGRVALGPICPRCGLRMKPVGGGGGDAA